MRDVADIATSLRDGLPEAEAEHSSGRYLLAGNNPALNSKSAVSAVIFNDG